MITKHHPGDELLLDYASGAMTEGWSLAIGTHLAFCDACRSRVSELEAIGGTLIDDMAPASMDAGAFNDLLARLDRSGPTVPEAPPPARPQAALGLLPQPLRQYVGSDLDDVKWRRLGQGAYQFLVPTSESGANARLLRIPHGKPVPEHGHNGQELTVVLCGAFSDATGQYGRGDIQQADASLVHQPHAAPEEDCICLAVTDAPLRFKSLTARLAQPFLGI
jgi:putative transcriptional regulator